MNPIKIFSPATIGNIGPGFDILGLAIDGVGDCVTAEMIEEQKIEFISDARYPELPTNQKNVAYHVAQLIYDAYKPTHGIRLTLEKNIPLCSGLGGSAASSAAAAFAVNELLGGFFTNQQLIRFAMEGERVASGSAHADNVAPALLGGLCLMSGQDDFLEVIQLPMVDQFYWSVVHPHCQAETRRMRDILPEKILLKEHVLQSSYLSLLLSGLLKGNPDWIKHGLRDRIVEPKRADFIPAFYAVREAALSSGALGFSISGSGPSVFAVSENQTIADTAAHAMQATFKQFAELESDSFVSKVNLKGTTKYEIYQHVR